MKSSLETLSHPRPPDRRGSLDEVRLAWMRAYKRIATQVNIPGFRKGKVPARIIEQRFGRAVVLEEALERGRAGGV